jgi:hypothetical protein
MSTATARVDKPTKGQPVPKFQVFFELPDDFLSSFNQMAKKVDAIESRLTEIGVRNPADELLTVDEFCKRIKRSRFIFERLRENSLIDIRKVGKINMIPAGEVDRFLGGEITLPQVGQRNRKPVDPESDPAEDFVKEANKWLANGSCDYDKINRLWKSKEVAPGELAERFEKRFKRETGSITKFAQIARLLADYRKQKKGGTPTS